MRKINSIFLRKHNVAFVATRQQCLSFIKKMDIAFPLFQRILKGLSDMWLDMEQNLIFYRIEGGFADEMPA